MPTESSATSRTSGSRPWPRQHLDAAATTASTSRPTCSKFMWRGVEARHREARLQRAADRHQVTERELGSRPGTERPARAWARTARAPCARAREPRARTRLRRARARARTRRRRAPQADEHRIESREHQQADQRARARVRRARLARSRARRCAAARRSASTSTSSTSADSSPESDRRSRCAGTRAADPTEQRGHEPEPRAHEPAQKSARAREQRHAERLHDQQQHVRVAAHEPRRPAAASTSRADGSRWWARAGPS